MATLGVREIEAALSLGGKSKYSSGSALPLLAVETTLGFGVVPEICLGLSCVGVEGIDLGAVDLDVLGLRCREGVCCRTWLFDANSGSSASIRRILRFMIAVSLGVSTLAHSGTVLGVVLEIASRSVADMERSSANVLNGLKYGRV